MVVNPAGKTFRRLSQQVRRCRPQYQKPAGPAILIDQRSNQRKQFRLSMDFIQNDKGIKVLFKVKLGLVEFMKVAIQFKVKIHSTARELPGD